MASKPGHTFASLRELLKQGVAERPAACCPRIPSTEEDYISQPSIQYPGAETRFCCPGSLRESTVLMVGSPFPPEELQVWRSVDPLDHIHSWAVVSVLGIKRLTIWCLLLLWGEHLDPMSSSTERLWHLYRVLGGRGVCRRPHKPQVESCELTMKSLSPHPPRLPSPVLTSPRAYELRRILVCR